MNIDEQRKASDNILLERATAGRCACGADSWEDVNLCSESGEECTETCPIIKENYRADHAGLYGWLWRLIAALAGNGESALYLNCEFAQECIRCNECGTVERL